MPNASAREGAVGRGVRIAADHGHTRQRRALLRTDDVHDALAHVAHLELGDAVLVAIGVEGIHLQPRHRIGDASCSRPVVGTL